MFQSLFTACLSRNPALARPDDFLRHAQLLVKFPMCLLGRRTSAQVQLHPVVGRQHHGHHLMRLQRLAHTRPRGVYVLVQQGLLNGDQQMIGQHAQKDVRLYAPLFLMVDRSFRQRALQRPEGRFGPRQQNVDPPNFLRTQIRAVGLDSSSTAVRPKCLMFKELRFRKTPSDTPPHACGPADR